MQKKKNIIFICHFIPCVRNKTRYQRANFLSEKYNVYFICRKGVCPDIAKHGSGLFIFPFRIFNLDRIFYIFWALWKIFQIVKTTDVSAIYSSRRSIEIIIAYISKKFFKLKWVLDFWDEPELELQNLIQYSSFRYKFLFSYYLILSKIAKNFIKSANLIILAMHPEVLDYYDTGKSKVVCLTNGVDLKYLRLLKFNKIENKESFVISYIGHLSKRRGIESIIEASVLIKDKIPNILFILSGSMNAADKKWLTRVIDSKKAKDYIIINSDLPHKRALEIINSSDICLSILSPNIRNYRYSYPIKIFEYMALGKVVIGSDFPGMRSILKHWVNGILINPNDVSELTEAILEIYQNKELRIKIEDNALESANKYDWKKINCVLEQKIKLVFI